ncbi:MAG: O-antigen ligase family protein [Isosphaerales bacterium]
MARRGAKSSVPPRPRPTPRPGSGQAPARGPADRDDEDAGRAASQLRERIRRVALGLTAALVTARAFWPSEPDLNQGAGAGLTWVLVLLVVAGLGLAASLIAGRFRFRWSWIDASVVALILLVAISASHAVDRRPAINLAWEWVALGIAYVLMRNLPRTRGESSALAGALVATAVAVSTYGLYQAKVELPLIQAEFQLHPRQMLEKLNIEPGTRGELMLKNRLMSSNEPWSTFALANSLAGFIVGPLVLALAVWVHNRVRRDEPGSRWTVLGMAAPLLLVLLVCLILTKSRSAYLGLIVGIALLAWRARRQVPARMLLAMGLEGLCVVAALVIAGLATGRLDRQVLTQSAMSARYRWEYWQGAWGVITGGKPTVMGALSAPTFWWGVGPGNFAAPYLMHKLPQSSEEILDPHNLFLEVWATGGAWALLALVAALAPAIWILLGRSSRAAASDDPAGATRSRGDARRQPAPPRGPNPHDDDEEHDVPPRRLGWLIASAGAGWALVVILGRLNPFEGDLFNRWLILGASWLAAVLLGAPLWRRLPIPAAALGAALVAVVINLFAAGGIGIPTVALCLWSMLALGLNLRDDLSCGRLREYESRMPAFVLALGWAALLGTFVGKVGPFWRSEAAIAAAEASINRHPPDFERAQQAYLTAIEEDRYNARPWLQLAAFYGMVWREHGSKVEDQEWRKVPILYQKAASAPRNPGSWALHADRARVILHLLSLVGPRLDPLEALKLRGNIVEATRTAALLHPTNADLHARLADASAEISMYKDAVTEAAEALRLDRITPHQDKKLPKTVRIRLEALIPRWTENAAKMPIQAAP